MSQYTVILSPECSGKFSPTRRNVSSPDKEFRSSRTLIYTFVKYTVLLLIAK